jgi:hypothetical protein
LEHIMTAQPRLSRRHLLGLSAAADRVFADLTDPEPGAPMT